MSEFKTGYGSKAIIPTDSEHFYLLQRTKNLLWTFFGGQCQIDEQTGVIEDPIEALRRELYEEGRLELAIPPEPRLIDIEEFTPEPDHQYQRIIRETRLACADGKPLINTEEHCKIAKVTMTEALGGRFIMDESTHNTLVARRELIVARLGNFAAQH